MKIIKKALCTNILPIEQDNMYKNRVRTKEQHKNIFEFPLLYLAEKMKWKLENLKSMYYVILNFSTLDFLIGNLRVLEFQKRKENLLFFTLL